jgi:hypothetical protein
MIVFNVFRKFKILNFSGLTSLIFEVKIIINIFRSADRVKYVMFFRFQRVGLGVSR